MTAGPVSGYRALTAVSATRTDKVQAAIASRSAGKWSICFQIELPDAEPVERQFNRVGTDLGLSSLVALATGETVPTPQHLAKPPKVLERTQRGVSRKKPNGNRQPKAKHRLVRLHARVANRRRDFSHQLSRSFLDRFTHIAIEDLNISAQARNMLAKSVANAVLQCGTIKP
jgi:putative transposase